jgi:hypothetical protein
MAYTCAQSSVRLNLKSIQNRPGEFQEKGLFERMGDEWEQLK